uniref:Uncharacterized protein n=1 Tax=Elaeophora elaphi TaxID=1147741 RepID=A0A0R3S1K9_9BILA
MEEQRRALYSYSWQQSPLNKRGRANPPEEERKIFDDWFEEKADEYFPLIRDQGLDDEIIRAANTSWTSSSPSYNPEMHRALTRVSPKMILGRLQRPKQDQKTLVDDEARKKEEHLANITRYERSLRETRKTIDNIKKEKQKRVMFSQIQRQRLSNSVVFPEQPACSTSSEVSLLQQKPYRFCEKQATERMKKGVSGNKKFESKLKSGSSLSMKRTNCNDIRVYPKQTASLESKQQTSVYHRDDDSDSELLRLALESSPIQKSNSLLRIASNEDELSDEALLAIMISSPVSSPKLKKNKRSIDS